MTAADLIPAMISLGEAGRRLDLSERTMRRYIAEGLLPGYRIAGTHTIRVKTEDVQALLVPVRDDG